MFGRCSDDNSVGTLLCHFLGPSLFVLELATPCGGVDLLDDVEGDVKSGAHDVERDLSSGTHGSKHLQFPVVLVAQLLQSQKMQNSWKAEVAGLVSQFCESKVS